MVENNVIVGLPHLVADNGIVATTEAGRELQVHGRIINLIHLDGHDLLQLLHLLLHLHGLRSLIAETLYKRLHISDFLLLVLVSPQLLFTTLTAQRDILVVLHAVVHYPAARDFQRTVRHIIDKGAVVTHQHHSRCRLRQELLQPLDRLNVEVVRRLVQQQHVGLLQQDFRQLDTHTPATRELTRRPLKISTFEA